MRLAGHAVAREAIDQRGGCFRRWASCFPSVVGVSCVYFFARVISVCVVRVRYVTLRTYARPLSRSFLQPVQIRSFHRLSRGSRGRRALLSPTPSPPLQLRTCTLSTVNRVKIVARERGPPLLAWWPRGGTGARSGQEGRGPARPLQDELHVLWVRATVPWPLRTSRSRNLRTGRNSMAPVALPPASPGDRESKTQRRVEKARARTCAAQTTTPMGDGLRARCTPLRHLRFVHISHFNGRHPNPKVGWVAVLTDPYTYAKYNRPSIPLRCCKISWTLN